MFNRIKGLLEPDKPDKIRFNAVHIDPRKELGPGAITELEPKIASRIVDKSKPVYVADTYRDEIEIHLYENQVRSLKQVGRFLKGEMPEMILYADLVLTNQNVIEEPNNSFFGTASPYFGFDMEDFELIQDYAEKYSEGFERYVRAEDFASRRKAKYTNWGKE